MTEKELWPGWKTVRQIGTGSYGCVYEIQRSYFGITESAALKVISIPRSGSDVEELYSEGYSQESVSLRYTQQAERIVSEYTIMRKMSGCPNVVSCDDMRFEQQEDGVGWNIFIKMELLTPLMRIAAEDFTEERVIKLGKDLCNALIVCEQQNILHRDVKPQNILLDEKGTFKLGDFGIAKAAENTIGGTKIGTYKYMAPEIYHSQPYGTAADIYSLGLVLYWLLNEHRMPFCPLPPITPTWSDDEKAKLRRLRGDLIPPPKRGSYALQEVVLKACAFYPENRYKNAEEMLQALEGAERQLYFAPVMPEQDLDKTVRVDPDAVDSALSFADESDETEKVLPGIEKRATKSEENYVHLGDYISGKADGDRLVEADNDQWASYENAEEETEHSRGKATTKMRIRITAGIIALVMILSLLGYAGLRNKEDENTQVPWEDPAAEGDMPASDTDWEDIPVEEEPQVSDTAWEEIAVGDVITFGRYEQDNNRGNGKEEIEWVVLEVENGRALVISKYALDCQPYHGREENVTWEKCSLRRWLNEDFVSTAFTSKERKQLIATTITAGGNLSYGTYPGNSTKDKVFALSIDELSVYIPLSGDRECKPTDYAVARGAYDKSDNGNCWWWLRSPGSAQNTAAYVYVDGSVKEYGYYVHSGDTAVRPALWIDLEAYASQG